jgi:GNAT superfamily N-acetyltransferase
VALRASEDEPGSSINLRPATPDDLLRCASIWRVSINDYTGRLNQPDIPDDLAAILRLYRHLQAGDPDGFVVAEGGGPAVEPRIVAFVSALRREGLWFLSMLFVLPEVQGSGIGRTLLRRVMPTGGSLALATCTDSVQPISNALYASLGVVPRMPLLRLVGLPDQRAELPPLPAGIRPLRFDEAADRAGDRLGSAALDGEIAALDRSTLGVEHPTDHAFIREEGRIGFLYLGPDGRSVGYAYASEAGRVGPIAVADPSLLAPVLGHVLTAVVPRGAFGIWVPGLGPAMPALLRAGFRIDGFPVLVCWDRPFAAFDRYVPISPGLL